MGEPFASVHSGRALQSIGGLSTYTLYLQSNKMSDAMAALSLWGLLEWPCTPLSIYILIKGQFSILMSSMVHRPDQ